LDREHVATDGEKQRALKASTSQSIDWLSVGQGRVIEVGGVRVIIKLVGQKGRRARVAIEAPAGTVFSPYNTGAGNR
jgi:hypothetical protein